MHGNTPRDQAIAFIAGYEIADAGEYEREVVRLAKHWLKVINSPRTTQGVVNKLLEQFDIPTPDGYGCAWDDLHERIRQWAIAEEWLAP